MSSTSGGQDLTRASDQSKMDAHQRAALQLMLTESASPYRLLPPLTQTFGEAATEAAYQMTCSHSRACGVTMIGIGALVVAWLRGSLHLAGYLTDENAPLRNSPAVVGLYVLMSAASAFLFSFGLYCMQSNKRAMEMRKPLHNCTRAAVIVIYVPLSLLTWLSCSVRNVEEWEWFLLGAVTITLPFLLSAMRLSALERDRAPDRSIDVQPLSVSCKCSQLVAHSSHGLCCVHCGLLVLVSLLARAES